MPVPLRAFVMTTAAIRHEIAQCVPYPDTNVCNDGCVIVVCSFLTVYRLLPRQLPLLYPPCIGHRRNGIVDGWIVYNFIGEPPFHNDLGTFSFICRLISIFKIWISNCYTRLHANEKVELAKLSCQSRTRPVTRNSS